jgi:hypothetical protein
MASVRITCCAKRKTKVGGLVDTQWLARIGGLFDTEEKPASAEGPDEPEAPAATEAQEEKKKEIGRPKGQQLVLDHKFWKSNIRFLRRLGGIVSAVFR